AGVALPAPAFCHRWFVAKLSGRRDSLPDLATERGSHRRPASGERARTCDRRRARVRCARRSAGQAARCRHSAARSRLSPRDAPRTVGGRQLARHVALAIRSVLTPAQLRAARALIGWSLSKHSGVGANTTKDFEINNSDPKLGTVQRWQRALEA